MKASDQQKERTGRGELIKPKKKRVQRTCTLGNKGISGLIWPWEDFQVMVSENILKAEMKVRRFIYEAKEGLTKTVPELD